jgi:hypothetical protein
MRAESYGSQDKDHAGSFEHGSYAEYRFFASTARASSKNKNKPWI